MRWFASLPPQNVVQSDLEERNIDFTKWLELAQHNPKLVHMLSECYAKHNFGHRRFDEHLHQIGVRLRLNAHCEWLLQEYEQLSHKIHMKADSD